MISLTLLTRAEFAMTRAHKNCLRVVINQIFISNLTGKTHPFKYPDKPYAFAHICAGLKQDTFWQKFNVEWIRKGLYFDF